MGLYDSYRLANSTAIPQFAGSVLPEAMAAKQELDRNYDLADSYNNHLNDALSTTPYFQNSAKEFKQVHDDLQNRLQQISRRKDLENMVPAAQQLAMEAKQKLTPFVQEQARFQAAVKALDDKDLNLDDTTKQLLIAKAIDDDKELRKSGKGGLQVDPIIGELRGGFQTINAAKSVELPKKIDQWVKDAAIHKYGSENVSYGNGAYMVKRGGQWEVLKPEEIQKIVSNSYKLDPEVQAYMDQQAALKGWSLSRGGKSTYDKLPVDDFTKADVDQAVAQGVPLKQAMQKVLTSSAKRDMYNNMLNLASDKYAVNNHTSTESVSEDGVWMQLQKQKHDDDREDKLLAGTQLSVPGMTMQPAAWAANPQGLNKGIHDLSSNIEDVQTRIAEAKNNLSHLDANDPGRTAASVEVATLQNQLNDLQTQRDQYAKIKQSNLDQAARNLHFGSFEQVAKRQLPQVQTRIEKAIGGKGLNTKAGKFISSKEIAQAMIDGRVAHKDNGGLQLTIPGKGSIYIPGKTSYTSSFSPMGGATPVYTNPVGQAYNHVLQDTDIGKVYDEAEKIYQQPKSLIVPGVTLTENQKKAVESALPSLTTYSADGLTKVLPPEDAVKHSFGTVNQMGYVPVEYFDDKGKSLGTLLADASRTGLRDNVGLNLIKSNTANPKMQQTGANLLEDSPANELGKLQPGTSIDGGYLNTKNGVKEVRFVNTNGTYAIVDAKTGEIIKDPNNRNLQSDDYRDLQGFLEDSRNTKPTKAHK